MPRRSTLRLTKRIVERLKADGKDAMRRIGTMNIKEILHHRHGFGLTRAQTRPAASARRIVTAPESTGGSCRSIAEAAVF